MATPHITGPLNPRKQERNAGDHALRRRHDQPGANAGDDEIASLRDQLLALAFGKRQDVANLAPQAVAVAQEKKHREQHHEKAAERRQQIREHAPGGRRNDAEHALDTIADKRHRVRRQLHRHARPHDLPDSLDAIRGRHRHLLQVSHDLRNLTRQDRHQQSSRRDDEHSREKRRQQRRPVRAKARRQLAVHALKHHRKHSGPRQRREETG